MDGAPPLIARFRDNVCGARKICCVSSSITGSFAFDPA